MGMELRSPGDDVRQNACINLHRRFLLILFVGGNEALLQRLNTFALPVLEVVGSVAHFLLQRCIPGFWPIQQELLRAGILLVSI